MFINNTNCARNGNIYPLKMPATYTYSKDCWDPNQANTLYDLTTAINQLLSYYYYCPSWSWRLTLGCCFVLIPLFVVAAVVFGMGSYPNDNYSDKFRASDFVLPKSVFISTSTFISIYLGSWLDILCLLDTTHKYIPLRCRFLFGQLS